MSYSFDTKSDRWSELADEYQSMLDELNSDETLEKELSAVMVTVADFDLDEVL